MGSGDQQGGGGRWQQRRREHQTFRMDQRPDFKALPKEHCTLTMLTGPSPGALFTLGADDTYLGRDQTLAWPIPDRGVSSSHARIFVRAGEFWVEDLQSTNGTYVNGTRIAAPRQLSDGDRIQLGEHTLLRVQLQDAHEQEASLKMYEAAVLDPLTGIHNRRHMETVLVAEYAFASRHHTPLSLAFIDLDHFSRINNTFGHQVGDEVLRVAAQAIRRAVRVEDLVARYGGEEFVVLVRGIDTNGAIAMAERIRRMIEGMNVMHEGTRILVTGSIGVACYEAATPYSSVGQLVAAADRAVYRAKANGRNCVCESLDAAPESWRTA